MAYITGFPSNSNITTTLESVSGNLSAGGVLTNNLYYANGQPWNFGGGGGSGTPGGSNTQIQFNNQNNFGGSANLTYDVATNNMAVGVVPVVDSGFGIIAGTEGLGRSISVAGGVMLLGSGTNVLRSTNGGTTWTTISTASASAYNIQAIGSDNNSTFIATTFSGDYPDYDGEILRSTDLGLTVVSTC